MKIDFPGGHTTIADDSETAIKIKEGYDYTVDNDGVITVGTMNIVQEKINDLKLKIQSGKATQKEKDDLLLLLI